MPQGDVPRSRRGSPCGPVRPTRPMLLRVDGGLRLLKSLIDVARRELFRSKRQTEHIVRHPGAAWPIGGAPLEGIERPSLGERATTPRSPAHRPRTPCRTRTGGSALSALM